MITNAYRKASQVNVADNSVPEQGVQAVSQMTVPGFTNKNARNHHSFRPANTSFAKTVQNDENPITQEAISDGLSSLFGAATGLDGLEIVLDYACDAVEFYDEFVQDRAPTLQPDPRLQQLSMPAMGMAA